MTGKGTPIVKTPALSGGMNGGNINNIHTSVSTTAV
jgi:hypothetical protein